MPSANASDESSPKRPPSKAEKSDIERTVRYSRWLLRTLGIWPMISTSSSRVEKFVSKCLIVVYLVAMAFPLVPTTLDTILRVRNPIVMLMRLGPMASTLSSMLKYVFIVIRCKRITLCMKHMEEDWTRVERDNERAIMKRNARVGRGVTIIAATFMYTAGMFYNVIMPLLKGTRVNERNETVRPVVYPGFDFFVDPQKSPNYEIIFFISIATSFVRYTVTITACNLAAVFVTHACGQVQIVMARLDSLFDGVDQQIKDGKLQQRISSVIHCHAKGLRLSSRIDDALREICLIEVVTATLIICLLEYYCMTEWNNSETVAIITYFVFLLSYIFNIFIFCYIGELLKEQCFQVGRSTYMIDWYKLPGKTGLAMVMILAVANCPRKITAGGMIELSVASFGMIMKTSVMYLNMLRAVAD